MNVNTDIGVEHTSVGGKVTKLGCKPETRSTHPYLFVRSGHHHTLSHSSMTVNTCITASARLHNTRGHLSISLSREFELNLSRPPYPWRAAHALPRFLSPRMRPFTCIFGLLGALRDTYSIVRIRCLLRNGFSAAGLTSGSSIEFGQTRALKLYPQQEHYQPRH